MWWQTQMGKKEQKSYYTLWVMVPSHGILVGENLFYLFFCVRHTPWLLDRFFPWVAFVDLKSLIPKKIDLVRALWSKNTEKTVIWRDNGLVSIKAKLNCWRGNTDWKKRYDFNFWGNEIIIKPPALLPNYSFSTF